MTFIISFLPRLTTAVDGDGQGDTGDSSFTPYSCTNGIDIESVRLAATITTVKSRVFTAALLLLRSIDLELYTNQDEWIDIHSNLYKLAMLAYCSEFQTFGANCLVRTGIISRDNTNANGDKLSSHEKISPHCVTVELSLNIMKECSRLAPFRDKSRHEHISRLMDYAQSDALLRTIEHSILELTKVKTNSKFEQRGAVAASELFTNSKKRTSDEFPSIDIDRYNNSHHSNFAFVENIDGCTLTNIMDLLIDSLDNGYLTLEKLLHYNIVNILISNPLLLSLQSYLSSMRAKAGAASTEDRNLVGVCMGYDAMGGQASVLTTFWKKVVVFFTTCIRAASKHTDHDNNDNEDESKAPSSGSGSGSSSANFLNSVCKFIGNYFELLMIPFEGLVNLSSTSSVSIQQIQLSRASVMIFNELNLVWKSWTALLPAYRDVVHGHIMASLHSLVCLLWEGEDEDDDNHQQFGIHYIALPISFEEIQLSSKSYSNTNTPAVISVFRARSMESFRDLTSSVNSTKSNGENSSLPSEFGVKFEAELVSLFVQVTAYIKNSLPLPLETIDSDKCDYFPSFTDIPILEPGSQVYYLKHDTAYKSTDVHSHTDSKSLVRHTFTGKTDPLLESKSDKIVQGIITNKNLRNRSYEVRLSDGSVDRAVPYSQVRATSVPVVVFQPTSDFSTVTYPYYNEHRQNCPSALARMKGKLGLHHLPGLSNHSQSLSESKDKDSTKISQADFKLTPSIDRSSPNGSAAASSVGTVSKTKSLSRTSQLKRQRDRDSSTGSKASTTTTALLSLSLQYALSNKTMSRLSQGILADDTNRFAIGEDLAVLSGQLATILLVNLAHHARFRILDKIHDISIGNLLQQVTDIDYLVMEGSMQLLQKLPDSFKPEFREFTLWLPKVSARIKEYLEKFISKPLGGVSSRDGSPTTTRTPATYRSRSTSNITARGRGTGLRDTMQWVTPEQL